MVIQCDSCQAKFRIDDSKVGAKGVKVRCTKCKNVFVVKPDAPPPAEAGEAPGFGEEAAAPPTPEPTPEPTEDQGAGDFDIGGDADLGGAGEEAPPGGFDLGFGEDTEGTEETPPGEDLAPGFGEDSGLGGTDSEEVPAGMDFGFGEEAPEPPPTEETAAAPGEGEGEGEGPDFGEFDFGFGEEAPKGKGGGAEDQTIVFSIDDTAGAKTQDVAAAAAAEEQTLFAGMSSPDDVDTTVDEPAPVPTAVKSGGSKKSRIALLLVLVLAGVGYLVTSGQLKVGGLDKVSGLVGSLLGGTPDSTIELVMVKATYAENPNIGKVFAIDGRLQNVLEEPQLIRAVRAILYDSTGKRLAVRTISPGAIVSKNELSTLTKDELLKRFKASPAGAIPPRGSIPVMAVFTDVPRTTVTAAIEVTP